MCAYHVSPELSILQNFAEGCLNLVKIIISDLQPLKNEEIIEKSTYKNIKPVRSKPDVLYGLGKVHKESNFGLPTSHPIISDIGPPTHK